MIKKFWKEAINAITNNALQESVMNVYPYMDNNGTIWIHLYPTKDSTELKIHNMLNKKNIQSEMFAGPHNISNVTSLSLDGKSQTFNKFMTESAILGATTPIGSEGCVRVSMAEYMKNKKIFDSLKGAESLADGIKRAEILRLETSIQEGFSANSSTNGFVYYVMPKKGKKLADLQQEFAKHGVPMFEYNTSLSPDPVLAIRAIDLRKQDKKVVDFFLRMLDRIKYRNEQSKQLTIHNIATQYQK